MKFDELNQLKRFFSIMDVENKDKRVSLAFELYEALLYIFIMIDTEKRLDKEKAAQDYYESLKLRFGDIFAKEELSYEEDYLNDVVEEVIDTTFRHLDEPYYVSKERALLIAQNESNTVYNHKDYTDAITQGKKYKTWYAELDDRTRPAHVEVDSMRIPIDELFPVGEDLMRYPHDWENGSPENLINCRCTCRYE